MGCWVSKLDRQETVSRCKARMRYMKHLVEARQSFSAAHAMYLRSLRTTGSALLHFATAETALHHRLPHPIAPPPSVMRPPPPPPPMSPGTDTWTTSTTLSSLPPPPPPPPATGSNWDFWDPFVPTAGSRSGTEEEWEAESTRTPPTAVEAASMAGPPSVVSGFSKETTLASSDLAVVVSRHTKGLAEIIKELDEYFLEAAKAGTHVSLLLEVPASCTFSSPAASLSASPSGKVHNCGRNLAPMMWTWGGGSNAAKINGFGKWRRDVMASGLGSGGFINGSHCSTLERLYAWEKKLLMEVKNAEALKMGHERKVNQLRKLELKRADYVKTEKTKKDVEKLESQLEVASQGIQTTSAEIIKLREAELYPQLLELVKGLMCMWRSMYECHQVQRHIVNQLKFLNTLPSTESTSELHRQSTLQLEVELNQWHRSFCNIVKAQRDYIQSLTGWLRLSLFQLNKSHILKARQDSTIYSLCEQWQLGIDHVPDRVASEGIRSLLLVIHDIVVQQGEEHRQKKKSEAANRELEKRASELRSLEVKQGAYFMSEMSGGRMSWDLVSEKRVKVEVLKVKAEEEKGKYEKAASVTRGLTVNNLQMSLPQVFQAITDFSSVCVNAFETVYNQAKGIDQDHDLRRLLP